MFRIIFPQVLAVQGDKHETIIIESADRGILFDPALKFDKVKKYNFDKIIITDSDEDCWKNLKTYNKDIIIYSNSAILAEVDIPDSMKSIPIRQGSDIGFLKNVRLLKLNPEVGRPAIGLRFRLESLEIVIAPEISPILSKSVKNLFKNVDVIIAGVGNFEKEDQHKITFLNFIRLCDNEFHPKKIFLTNLRQDILKHENEVNNLLKKYNGKIMKAGDVLISKELKKAITSEGIYLVSPHGRLIFEGKKKIIIKSKLFNIISDRPYVLCEDSIAYGNIFLSTGEKINLIDFNKLKNKHWISDEERKKWWKDKTVFYSYNIIKFVPYKALRKIVLPQGIQTFIQNVVFKSDINIIEKWKIPYEPESATDDQLRDDFRLFVAVFSKLEKGEKVRIEAGKENYFTKEILYKMIVRLLKEIVKRKKSGKMEFTISEKKSKDYEKLWNNLKKYLNKEEIEILTDKIKKSIIRSFSLQHHYWLKDDKKITDHFDISLDLGRKDKFWKFSVLKNPIEIKKRQDIFSHHYCDNFDWFYLNKKISSDDPLWVSGGKGTAEADMIVELIDKGNYEIEKLNNGYQIEFYSEKLKGIHGLIIEKNGWEFGVMIDLNKIEKSLKPSYMSLAKPAYRGDIELIKSDLEHLGWDKEDLLIDVKCDGTRETAGKIDSESFIFTDPEGLKKKSPNISKRLPILVKELEKSLPDNTVLDAELLMLSRNKEEFLHRTNVVACLNSKEDPKIWNDYMILYVFDIIFFKGKDVRDLPLSDRLDILHKIKSTDHIWIERISKDIKRNADSYIIKGNNFKSIKTIWDKIINDKIGRPKFMAEGVLIKKLSHKYEYPQNKGWLKVKRFLENNCVVFDKKQVKGSKNTFNYFLGIDINSEYASQMLEDIKAKNRVVALYDNKIYKKHECDDLLDYKKVRFLMYFGKTDNTNIKCNTNDILRCASEEILYNENKTNPDFPFYTGYINRAMEKVPEVDVSDKLETFYRLSLLQPKRIPVEEVARWKQESITKSLENKWSLLSKEEIKSFNFVNEKKKEGEKNGEEGKTKEERGEVSTTRSLSVPTQKRTGQTEEKVELNGDSNGDGREETNGKEEEKEQEKKEREKRESEIIVGKQEWVYLKCPSCLSSLSFPSLILNENEIKCPFCNHIFLIKKVDDSI